MRVPTIAIVLPTTTATLAGSVTDDGRPGGAPSIGWSLVEGPGSVTFAAANQPVTLATFGAVGAYRLRLTASDGQFTVSDEVKVTLDDEPPPIVSVADASVAEGSEGASGGLVEVQLSKPWIRPVRVDYVTLDGTATNPCDYQRSFGTLGFAPGETTRSVLVPVAGDQAPEGDEDLEVVLGNPVEATLGRDRAVVSRDGRRRPEPGAGSATSLRSPATEARSVTAPATLRWSSFDPDAADSLTHDVYVGSAVSLSGQQWLAACAAGIDPGPRSGAATGYDEANDRLIVYGGETPSGAADTDVYVLVHASAAGGAPAWERYAPTGGPGPLAHAGLGLRPGLEPTRRLRRLSRELRHDERRDLGARERERARRIARVDPAERLRTRGALRARCGVRPGRQPSLRPRWRRGETPARVLGDTWVLDGANGLGAAAWRELAPAGTSPSARLFASLTHDASSGRLVLFGGRDAGGDSARGHAGPRGRRGRSARLDAARAVASWARRPLRPRRRLRSFDSADCSSTVERPAASRTASTTSSATPGCSTNADGSGASPEWVPVDAGRAPAGRVSAATAWSAGANRLIVFGGANNKLAAPPADLWLLGDAFGQLPLASAGQAASSYEASEAADGRVYLWRVVTRDPHGAWRGTPAWSFTVNRPPVVDAGPDQAVATPPGVVSSRRDRERRRPAGGRLAHPGVDRRERPRSGCLRRRDQRLDHGDVHGTRCSTA